jgi:ribose 5-phosphate isomerase A
MNSKLVIAQKALPFILEKLQESDVILGLGSGSTIEQFIHLLATAVESQKIKDKIKCVATSWQTRLLILKYSKQFVEVPLWSVCEINFTVDGADSILPEGNFLVKGGGAALLQEKLVALSSRSLFILAEQNKLLKGNVIKVPIEVLPLALTFVQQTLTKKALKVELRQCTGAGGAGKCGPIVTDNGNFILDATFDRLNSELAEWIKAISGVIEHGIFHLPYTLITESED